MAKSGKQVPVVTIVGRGDSGKTTFLEKLIRELTDRGVRVATVKHHVHDYDIDIPGKDSWRHARAGAVATMVSSPEKFALVRRVDREMTLDELTRVALDAGADLLLAEGFKRQGANPIEVLRGACSSQLVTSAEALLALVTDVPETAPGVQHFALDDAAGVADLIEARFLGAVGEA